MFADWNLWTRNQLLFDLIHFSFDRTSEKWTKRVGLHFVDAIDHKLGHSNLHKQKKQNK